LFKPGSLPGVRLAFFCGEALSALTAGNFAAAAPLARIVNLWGPTEATVSFTWFDVHPDTELPDVVPIGRAYADQRLAVVDGSDCLLPPGEIGELIQSGSQVTVGYWQSPELNAAKFLELDGRRWYRSGDLAVWDERYGYCYMGRADRQVKVKGYRIELQDCESALRRVSGQDLVCVVPWPRTPDGAILGLAGFICGTPADAVAATDALRIALKDALPVYMVPERLMFLPQFPFNSNGKVDYKALESQADALLGGGADSLK
jgi:acyl-CoA synthetase (AMP-forming)/AMP-acid ligase II